MPSFNCCFLELGLGLGLDLVTKKNDASADAFTTQWAFLLFFLGSDQDELA
jgi:hypothetical protein